MELVPYTETRRDRVERRLAEEANKRELNWRRDAGITVIAYWLVKENTCTIWVHDERNNAACEFPVANEEVMEWFNHPFANKDAHLEPRFPNE